MEQITKLSVHSLKVHPRNQEFFDDIDGEMYKQFKKSIQEDGVITPIIVAPDMVVVSGNQRLKACMDLGIELIPAIIREELINENAKTRQLIAANFGRLSNNPTKMRKAIAEYVELVGKKLGDNQWVGTDYLPKLTQFEIAHELGISERELRNLLSLENNLIPELQQAMDKGFISKTAALGICGKLDTSEQKDLLSELTKLIGGKSEDNPNKDKVSVTNAEIQKLYEEIKLEKEKNQKLIESNTELLLIQTQKQLLDTKVKLLEKELVARPTIEKEIDKKETLIRLKQLEESEKKIKQEKDDYTKKYTNALVDLQEEQKKVSKFMGENTNFELISSTSELTLKMINFIKDMAKYDYLAEVFNEIPDATRREYVRSIYGVYKWARNVLNQVKYDDVLGLNKNTIEIKNFVEVDINE